MEEPAAATARKPASGPSLRRLVWWTLYFCLAALLLIRLPVEVSYWMLALAEKASLEGRTDAALAWVERAKGWTPESTLPRKLTGSILERAGKLDELGRIDFVLQQEDLKPKQKAALHLEKSQALRRKQRYEDALAELDQAADFEGSLRPSRERLELLLLAKRENEVGRELKQLLDACSTDEQRAQVHLWKCEFHQKHAQWEEALQEFDAAAECQPKLRPSIGRLELLMLAKREDETKQELDQLLETSTSDADKAKFHLGLSAIHRRQGRWDEALREFDEAAQLEPKYRPAVERLELLLLLGDKHDEAKQELMQLEQQLAKSWGQSRTQIDNLVAYYSALLGDDLEQALTRAEKALAAEKYNPAILDTRAYVLYRLQRYEEALDDANRAVEQMEEEYQRRPMGELGKSLAVIVYHRSLVLDALGKSSEAERDRARVRELGFEPNERLF